MSKLLNWLDEWLVYVKSASDEPLPGLTFSKRDELISEVKWHGSEIRRACADLLLRVEKLQGQTHEFHFENVGKP